MLYGLRTNTSRVLYCSMSQNARTYTLLRSACKLASLKKDILWTHPDIVPDPTSVVAQVVRFVSHKFHYFNSRGGRRSKCPGMWLFWCRPCLMNITRWSTKFGVNRTTPVVWVGFPFKFWHWVFTFEATTPQPEPLFIPKQDDNTSFMTLNHPGF
jgi:hypothetical protein